MEPLGERKEAVRARFRAVTREDSDERERLLNAVDEVPFRRLDEVQTENRILMGLRIFERDLAGQFNAVGMRMSPLSSWTRDHLEFTGDDYIHRMWKRFVAFTYMQIPAYNYGSYDAFRTHIWRLNELGLIEPTREEAAGAPGRKKRQFYRIVPGMEDHPAWENPTGSLYPTSTPVHVTETVNDLIEENGEQPTVEEVAAELDMDTDQLTARLNQWSIDLEEQTRRVLNEG
jgi:hypothetical protein